MTISSLGSDTTAEAKEYSVAMRPDFSPRRRTRVWDTSDQSFWPATLVAAPPSDFWLIYTDLNDHVADRASDLRKKTLDYRAERPHDSALAQAVNDALKFIDLVPAIAVLPQAALADDGEVNLFWREDGLLIDVGFTGDGMMHYYVSVDAEGVDFDDSVEFVGRSLPREIVRAIPRLSSLFGTSSRGVY